MVNAGSKYSIINGIASLLLVAILQVPSRISAQNYRVSSPPCDTVVTDDGQGHRTVISIEEYVSPTCAPLYSIPIVTASALGTKPQNLLTPINNLQYTAILGEVVISSRGTSPKPITRQSFLEKIKPVKAYLLHKGENLNVMMRKNLYLCTALKISRNGHRISCCVLERL